MFFLTIKKFAKFTERTKIIIQNLADTATAQACTIVLYPLGGPNETCCSCSSVVSAV